MTYIVSSDREKLDIEVIHDFLSNQSHWARGRTREKIIQTINNSLCFGVYDCKHNQVGFGRVVTDYTVYAYIMDVFILPLHRGRGLGKLLIQEMLESPELKSVENWSLSTKKAKGFYEKFGFTQIEQPERMMQKRYSRLF